MTENLNYNNSIPFESLENLSKKDRYKKKAQMQRQK